MHIYIYIYVHIYIYIYNIIQAISTQPSLSQPSKFLIWNMSSSSDSRTFKIMPPPTEYRI